jgi:hypothetical protein
MGHRKHPNKNKKIYIYRIMSLDLKLWLP